MRWSRVRYLLQTSRGPVGAAPIAAAIGYAVLSHLTWWRGDWRWGYNHLGQTVPVLMLVTAFVVGWDAGSPNSGYRALVERIPASRWRVVGTLIAAPLGLAYLLYAFGLAVVVTATWSASGVVDPRSPLLIGSHLLMIFVAAAVGLQVGRVLTSPYAALASAALVGLVLFDHVGSGQNVFLFSGTAGPAAGSVPGVEFYEVNLATLLLVSVALAAPLGVTRNVRVAVGGGLALATTVFMATSIAGPTNQFVTAPSGPTRCSDDEIEVCVYAGYDRLLPIIEQRLDHFLKQAAIRGVPRSAFPSRLLQRRGVSPAQDVATLQLGMFALRDNTFDSQDLAGSVTSATWCPALFGHKPPIGLLGRRDLVFYWIQYIDDGMSRDSLTSVEPKFARLSPTQQAARIVAAMGELRRCDNS